MSRQNWVEAPWVATVSGTAVASTAAETILMPNITIPALYLNGGRRLRGRISGQYSTTATPTIILGLRFGGVGGTLLAKTAAVTTPSGVTAALWSLDFTVQSRSDGSAGTLLVMGEARIHSAVAPTVGSATGECAVTPFCVGGVVSPAVVTCDLTADTALSVTWTWSASSASNTATALDYTLESMN